MSAPLRAWAIRRKSDGAWWASREGTFWCYSLTQAAIWPTRPDVRDGEQAVRVAVTIREVRRGR